MTMHAFPSDTLQAPAPGPDASVLLAPQRVYNGADNDPELSPDMVDRRHPRTDSALTRQLSQTPSLLPWVGHLALLAQHDIPVLLTGETGTGKTWLARLLHDCSPRTSRPFVTVPCGALSPTLTESEFFGHSRGAFTGADRARSGKLAAAGSGSLLLDEIDTLRLEQQAKLLRVLDTGEYEPVGSSETLQRACRIMAASNADLGQLVQRREFRADLYYRLHVLPFHVPALRERVQDIAPLARGLASRYANQFRKDLSEVSPKALALLEAYPWPGNIRELDNVMRQAVLLARGPVLLPEHVPERIQESAAATGSAAGNTQTSLETAERLRILRALANHGHNRTRAAEELGISRVMLYKKLTKYGIV
jgi:transcriptional regulator with PAS, ATPase and Fis domain